MKIRLKKGAILAPTNNKHGLTLDNYYLLESGQIIEVKKIPESLKDLVEKVKKEKK
jgi:hypothetical protein